MLTFEPYSPETLKKYLPWIERSPYRCNDLSVGTLYMWQEGTDVRFCLWHDTFLIRQDVGDQPAFTWPYGADPEGMLRELCEYVKEQGLALRFFAMDEDTLHCLRRHPRFGTVMAAFDDRWSDYIYSFGETMTFRGKKFSGQRNHINKFIRLYGEPVVRLLKPEDTPRLQAMLRRYEAQHADAGVLEKQELERAEALVRDHEALGLPAACLLVGDEIAAFSVGEVIGDMLLIHVEKALTEYEGAYPTMYQGFVRLMANVCPQAAFTLVNREDDSGDPGLRTSKQQYQPIGKVRKYLCHLHSPAASLGEELPVLREGEAVLTAIREGDRDAYLCLNTDIENNRLWGYDYREDWTITGPLTPDTFYDSVRFDMAVGDSVNFAVRKRGSEEMIGEAILWKFTENGRCEVGCRLLPEYQGRGLGNAAFAAAARFARQQLGLSLLARCFRENERSRRMILAAGFRETGADEKMYYFAKD